MRFWDEEPPLEEILADPIVRILMARDAVAEQGLRQVIFDARHRLDQAETALVPHRIPGRHIFQSGMPSR